LLGRVFMNLASNAVKYSDVEKGSSAGVLIGAVAFSNRVRVDVVDNGVGIPRNRWNDIFKPFTQLANPERDREKGVGLGLSIVRAILPLLSEHRIDMNSTEGRGTRFSIEMPRISGSPLFPAPVAKSLDMAFEALAGTYVFYVEDDALVRNSTISLFEGCGILYEAVASLDEAKARLQTLDRIPNLIMTDYRLPHGHTAQHVVATVWREYGLRLPTIVLTGEVSSFENQEWLGFPVRVHRKPIAPEVLLREISIMLHNNRNNT
jgi:two-component system, sensor histidine kinase